MLGIVFQHQELQIIKGVAKFPSDPNSAEQGLFIFDLQNEQYFTLKRNGYQPNIPTHEAVWGDSVLRDGRFPVTGREINVTETIRLTAKADSWQDLAGRLSVLNRLVQDCHDFWETEYQIEPVYLKWWARGAPGEQYALLYKMDVIVNREDDDSTMMDVRIELEREPLWRGLAPGANPILWHLRDRHADISVADLTLVSGTDHLATATIQNRHEWDPTDYVTRLSQNFIDIPATSIPGDAPALMVLTLSNAVGGNNRQYGSVFLGVSTTPVTTERSDGFANDLQLFNTLNAADGDVVGAMAVVNDSNGVFSDGSAVTEKIIQGTITSATTTLTQELRFTGSDISALLDVNIFRGSWAVFCRHVVTTGTDGDLKMQWRYGLRASSTADLLIENDEADLQVVKTEVAGDDPWNIAYLGIMTLPVGLKAISDIDGTGLLSIGETFQNWEPQVYVRNTAGADRVLEVVDFILMPLDNGFCQAINSFLKSNNNDLILDNTSYLAHGAIGDKSIMINRFASSSKTLTSVELRGRIPTLTPNVNNRIFFLYTQFNDLENEISKENSDTIPRINIIPRWRGIRDVK